MPYATQRDRLRCIKEFGGQLTVFIFTSLGKTLSRLLLLAKLSLFFIPQAAGVGNYSLEERYYLFKQHKTAIRLLAPLYLLITLVPIRYIKFLLNSFFI
jgi:hypothetical protein